MAFEKNIAALFGGGDEEPKIKQGSGATHGKLDDTADIRDYLSGLVSENITDLSSQDAKAYFAGLAGIVGRQEAQKLVTHIILFNQRDDVKGKSPEAKVAQFYRMGSQNDPSVDNIIKGAGSFSMGPTEGLKTSPDILSRRATNRNLAGSDGNVADADKIKNIAQTTIKN